MKTHIVSAPATPELTPLAHATPPGELKLAGDSLRGWQEKRLGIAGFELVKSEDAADILLSDCAWLHDEALTRIHLESKPASFLTPEDVPAEDGFFIRYAWDFIRLNEEIVESLAENHIKGEVHKRATVEGHLSVGEGSRVLPGVYIEGNVVIGKNCKIGPNCYIRGNTSIGDNCHIGQSVEIKNSIIMSGTNVGHLSYVGDSVIARDVNLGAGTITANFRHDESNHISRIGDKMIDTGRRKFGTIIGNGVHTGIHTSIYPGRKIGAGCMTLPGDVVRKDVE